MDRLFPRAEEHARAYLVKHAPEEVQILALLTLPPSGTLSDELTTTNSAITHLEARLDGAVGAAYADAVAAGLRELRGKPPAEGMGRALIMAELQQLRRHRIGVLDQLERAQQRDAIQATRPDGCFCLGLGGRGALMALEGKRFWSEWCRCPDGERHRAAIMAPREEDEAEEAWAERAIAIAAEELDLRRHGGWWLESAMTTEAEEAERMAKGLEASGLPDWARSMRLYDLVRTPENTAAMEEADRWLLAVCVREATRRRRLERHPGGTRIILEYDPLPEDVRPGLFIHGQAGGGKTTLAALLLVGWIGMGNGGRFVSVPSLMARLRESFREGTEGPSSGELLQPLRTSRLVVLDDLGAERGTEWSRSVLFELLDARYAARAPTLITSNLAVGDAASAVASGGAEVEVDRMAGRIVQLCKPLHLGGRDWRQSPPTGQERAAHIEGRDE